MAIERILWGDDSESFVKSASSALAPEYKVDIALTPEGVIKKVLTGEYQAVITDLNYTEGKTEGFDIIRALKGKVPYIILCTGDCSAEPEAKSLGADSVFFKPIRLMDLIKFLGGLK